MFAEPRRTPKRDADLAAKWHEAVLMHEPLRQWVDESRWTKKKTFQKEDKKR